MGQAIPGEPVENRISAGGDGANPFSMPPAPNGFAYLIGLLRPRAKLALAVRRSHPWGYTATADDTAVMYVFRKGEAYFKANGSVTRVGQGDIVIVHGVDHSLSSAENVPVPSVFPVSSSPEPDLSGSDSTHEFSIIVYTLNVTAECKYRFALPSIMTVPSPDGNTPPWHRAVSELSRMVRVREPDGSSAIADQLSELLFTLTVQDYSDRMKRISGKDAVGGGDPKLVSLVLEMQSRPSLDWSIDSMAERLFMSRSSFCDMFSRVMGEAPIQYLTRTRMGIAADTLLASNLSADEIAELVGYGSAPALVRAFRRHFKLTPTEYRRKHRLSDHQSIGI